MWKAEAKRLRIGQHRKVMCCGSDPSAIINNGDAGVSIYCFRCGRQDWEKHGPRSVAEIMAMRRAVEVIERAASMPHDALALMDSPPEALLWVLRGGLSPEMANNDYGFRYDPKTRLVLMPTDEGVLARDVFGGRPKYRLFGPGRSYMLRAGHTGVTVVVEDVLSCIAVNRAGWRSLAVLGTTISSTQAAWAGSCTRKGSRPDTGRIVVGWFDNDRAGDVAWIRLRKAMALHPVRVVKLTTDKDPKCYHQRTIQTLIEETLNDPAIDRL